MFYYGNRLKIYSFAIPIYHLCYYITYIDPHKRIKTGKTGLQPTRQSLQNNRHRLLEAHRPHVSCDNVGIATLSERAVVYLGIFAKVH